MITNDSELAIVREQLANCEAAIESLRRKLLPDHERNFQLYARPWLDLQQEFQSDIDAYLRSRAPSANGSPRSKVTDVQDFKLT
jgi:hypothetical protein